MNYPEALEQLYSIGKLKKEWDLEVIQRLLAELGSPQKKMKVINVAGTNGKGSVTVMVASILKEAGHPVGQYTSPHVDDFRERIVFNGEKIPKGRAARLLEKVQAAAVKAGVTPSFFEVVTALALLFFAEKKVAYAVLEAGMGGRLDATNIGGQECCVITNVSLEHTEMLGKTVEEVSREKAALVTGKLCVTGCYGKALTEILRKCEEAGARVVEVKESWEKKRSDEWANECKLRLHGEYNVRLSLLGEHQFQNAALATACIEEMGVKASVAAVEAGLAKAKLPARMEVISREPLVIMDGAHNPAALKALARSLKGFSFNRLLLVMGMMEDKNVEESVAQVAPLASVFVATESRLERSAGAERVASAAEEHCPRVLREKNPGKALEKALREAKKGDLVLLTGSIYVVSEARGANELAVAQ